MAMYGLGWLGAIIVGGLAGWLAERFMKSRMGLLANIVLGIAGAIVFKTILHVLGLGMMGGGWVAYLVAAFIGACLLIWLGRWIRS
ncbi:MAG: GlsB/YeaQ/YmgE family stress response membrane protein [Oricola sp.]